MRGKARSSAKRVAPVTLATASTLRSAFPMTECLTVGMLEGGSPSNLPTFPRLAVAIQRFPGGLRDFPTHPCGSQLYRLVDLDVAGAAAEVARQSVLDFVACRLGVLGEQGFSGEEKGGRAVTALGGPQVGEGLLQGMQLAALRHRFDGSHGVAGARETQHQA